VTQQCAAVGLRASRPGRPERVYRGSGSKMVDDADHHVGVRQSRTPGTLTASSAKAGGNGRYKQCENVSPDVLAMQATLAASRRTQHTPIKARPMGSEPEQNAADKLVNRRG